MAMVKRGPVNYRSPSWTGRDAVLWDTERLVVAMCFPEEASGSSYRVSLQGALILSQRGLGWVGVKQGPGWPTGGPNTPQVTWASCVCQVKPWSRVSGNALGALWWQEHEGPQRTNTRPESTFSLPFWKLCRSHPGGLAKRKNPMGGMAGMSLLRDSVAVGQQPSTWAGKPRGAGESGHGTDSSGIPGSVTGRLVAVCMQSGDS